MKKLILLILIVSVISCKKKKPPLDPPKDPKDTVIVKPNIDTSKVGAYKMVVCVPGNELSSVFLQLKYRGYKQRSADTNDKAILYNVLNIPALPIGKVKISATQTFTNEGTNLSQPYLEVFGDNAYYGFIESPKIKLLSGSFSVDTLILNFSTPIGNIKGRYKKQ